ncbi:required for drug-induced death protein 1 [Danio aesculapii]|uniref:required for drug-induced death protein 1 n=1 Tax=Danio aesculapii TaxID=1142201 RepID=UPI0024BF9D48|nr:required for drug-induced death protein 1 [Danio aesculapii]
MPRKRVKYKRKSKDKKGDKSKIVPSKADQPPAEVIKAQHQSHVLDQSLKSVNKKEKSAKQVHIAFLQEKYEPLVEEDISDQPRDDNSKKKQDKYKKFRKNVRKAFRYSWKCLVVGLQNLSTAYSMPLGVSVVPEVHRARAHV